MNFDQLCDYAFKNYPKHTALKMITDIRYREESEFKLANINIIEREGKYTTLTNFLDSEDLIVELSKRKNLKKLIQLDYKDLTSLSIDIATLFLSNLEIIKDFKLSTPVLFSLTLNDITGQTKETKIKRLLNSKFIYKKLSYLYNSFKDTNIIYSKELLNPISSFGSSVIHEREKKQREYLEKITLLNKSTGEVMIDENDQFITLYDLQKNKNEKKLKELYCVNKALEEKARVEEKTFLFVTLTLPAIFKPCPANGNNSYDDYTVKEGVKLLNKVFENFRKRKNDLLNNDKKRILKSFRNKSLSSDVFGFWSKEPQADGTPHTHFLIYLDKKDIHIIKRLFQYVVAQTFKKAGFKRSNATLDIKHDNGNASPATYIFKYIMKALSVEKASINDNGEEKTIQLDQEEIKVSKENYKLHSYRRYGTFGIQNALGVWRELKRLTYQKELLKDVLKQLVNRKVKQPKSINNYEIDTFKNILRVVKENDFYKFLTIYNKDILRVNYKESKNEYDEIIKTPLNLYFNGNTYTTKKDYIFLNI